MSSVDAEIETSLSQSDTQVSKSENTQKILTSHVWRDMFLWEYKSTPTPSTMNEEQPVNHK